MAKQLARKSLTLKLILAVVAVSIVLTLISSLLQTYFIIRVETEKVESLFDQIERDYLPEIAEAIWSFDEATLDKQLSAIHDLPNIEALELVTNIGGSYRKGSEQSQHTLRRKVDVIYNDDGSHVLGTFRVIATTENTMMQLKNEFGYTLLAEAVKISISALIILLIIRQLVTSRLALVANYAGSLSVDNLQQNEKVYRQIVHWEDEISEVAIALNSMRESLQNGIETLNKAYEKLHDNEQKFKTLVNNIPGAIYRCRFGDGERVARETVFMSDAITGITGYSKFDFLNQEMTVETIIDDFHRKSIKSEISRCANEGKSYRLEYKIIDAENQEKWIYDCGSVVKDSEGQVTFIDGVLFDITEKKLLDEALQQFNEQLEVRVQQRTIELKKANDELKSAQSKLVESEKMAALGGMVAGVAHEINTPIGVGLTAVSHLMGQTTNLFSALTEGKLTRTEFEQHHTQIDEGLEIISKNLQRMATLIKSFKLVAVDQSNQDRRLFNFKEYLEDVVLTLKPTLNPALHSLEISCPDELSIDSYPSALYQIVTNLVMNTLNHGFTGDHKGKISIEVKVVKKHLVLNYQDDGVGMEPEVAKEIFTPFFTTSRQQGGTGLGMHIVYNLVTQLLKGEINCYSKPGEGVRFVVSFPVVPPS